MCGSVGEYVVVTRECMYPFVRAVTGAGRGFTNLATIALPLGTRGLLLGTRRLLLGEFGWLALG